MAKPPKPHELASYERRPWPKRGDRSVDQVYSGVGRALSQWEIFEGSLSLLFSYFVLSEAPFIARRAYNAVRTFEGRAEMLKAASEAYFTLRPNDKLQSEFVEVYKSARNFSPRRNDIAHGVIAHFRPQRLPKNWLSHGSFALFPSYANFKDRDVTDEPAYCYTSVELEYFYNQFWLLTRPAHQLAGRVVHIENDRASQHRRAARYRGSTSQVVARTDQQ